MPFIGNQPALSYTSFAKQDFTTSATTSYTLDNPVTNENELALFINFVRQEPTTAYTATNTSLTLTSATSASDDMYCVYLGKAIQTVNPPAGSVGASQISDGSIALGKLSATGTKDATTFLRGDNTFDTPPLGGITEADSFRLSATQAISSGTDTVLTGFSRDNESTFGKIGTGISESSGIFTMGATGIYLLIANFYMQINGDLTYASPKIQGTTNNSGYVNMAYNDQSIKQVVGNTYCANTTHAVFDCQDTSNYKFRLSIYGTHAFNVMGSASDSHTYVTAIRLGDT